MHPRLFTTILLLDPVIFSVSKADDGDIQQTILSSTYRRDLWPSRQTAAESLKRNKFYQTWDPRVLDKWIEYGLRDVPTALFPDIESAQKAAGSGPSDVPVTLTTTRHQEVFTFGRPNFDRIPDEAPYNRKTHPDLYECLPGGWPFYRPEVPLTFMRLPYVRPSVLYFFGELSEMSHEKARNEKMEVTGVGIGGSGGAKEGRVKAHLLKNVGHLIAMEAVDETARLAAEWIGPELRRWKEDEEAFRAEWRKKSKVEKATIDEGWKRVVPMPVRRPKSKL